jgi:hypothetical protein
MIQHILQGGVGGGTMPSAQFRCPRGISSGDGDEAGIGQAGDRRGVSLADSATTKQPKSQGFGHRSVSIIDLHHDSLPSTGLSPG